MSKIGRIIDKWTTGVKTPKDSQFILQRLTECKGEFSEKSPENTIKRTSKKWLNK